MLDFNKRNRSARQINDSEDLFAADDNFEEENMPETESVKQDVSGAAAAVPENNGYDSASLDKDAAENISIPRKRRRRTDDIDLDKAESSRLLEEGRCRMGLSAAEVEEMTKIRALYVQALEQGDYKELPQPVYTLAYIRRLCELYDIGPQETEKIIEPWREVSFEAPDNYPMVVYSDESGDNRKVIRRLEAVIFSVIALLVIALAVFGIVLLVSLLRGGNRSGGVAFDEAEIVKLQEAPKLKITEPLPQLRNQ